MANIPSEFVDQLLDRIDIVDIVSQRVTLKKAGKDYQALCPFHTENTPSFTVSQNKQFYHCFGCGKHGSAIGFLMEFEGLDFVDTIETLAQKVGMEVPIKGNYTASNQGKNL
ncbi:MAG TPA: DNA primase, partial [Oceanospirillales bacterium]|nr:DNA primase [Oceanospirillales bacterium]